jgi:hypothetical protein
MQNRVQFPTASRISDTDQAKVVRAWPTLRDKVNEEVLGLVNSAR